MAAISCTLLIDDTLPWAVLMGDEQRIIRRFNQQVACMRPFPEALFDQSLTEADLLLATSAPLL